jgi:hypothetical protein
MLATLALVATLWSGDAAIVPIGAAEEDQNQPVVSHPYLYTTAEIAAVLAGGAIWYLRNGTEGYGRAWGWHGWKRKLLADDVTFDSDHFNTNTVGHPMGGTAYYQIARGNGFGPGPSFLAAVLASTFWEYAVELPEHPSINDMIMTPVGGAIIGEASYQLGRYFARSGTGTARCTGAFLFAPVAALNDRPICRSGSGFLPWARLGLLVGAGRAMFDGGAVRDEIGFALGSEIVSQRAYQRPGSGTVMVMPGQWTALHLDARFGESRLSSVWFHARTLWGGRYDRHYHGVGDETDGPPVLFDGPRGWGLLVALGSSFDYRLRDLPRVHDRIASVGIGGPTFELSRRGSVLVRASFMAQYAFAIIGAMAYWPGDPQVLGQVIKTPLRSAGYYYGHGVVSAATLLVDLGPVGFTADARGGWYWSIDSGDPEQSSIQRRVLLHDSRLYLSASMWSRPVVGAFRFGLVVEQVRRASYMLDSRVAGTEVDVLATTAIGF